MRGSAWPLVLYTGVVISIFTSRSLPPKM